MGSSLVQNQATESCAAIMPVVLAGIWRYNYHVLDAPHVCAHFLSLRAQEELRNAPFIQQTFPLKAACRTSTFFSRETLKRASRGSTMMDTIHCQEPSW